MQYKPTWSSFLGAAVYALVPVATASVVTFFLWETASTILLIGGALMAALSLFLLLQDLFVHLQRLYVDEYTISISGPFGRRQIRWSEVTGAVLKERKNAMTRTDHLLVLRGPAYSFGFNTSTLSESDEEQLLTFVRCKVSLVVEQSKPSI